MLALLDVDYWDKKIFTQIQGIFFEVIIYYSKNKNKNLVRGTKLFSLLFQKQQYMFELFFELLENEQLLGRKLGNG